MRGRKNGENVLKEFNLKLFCHPQLSGGKKGVSGKNTKSMKVFIRYSELDSESHFVTIPYFRGGKRDEKTKDLLEC